MNLNNLSLSLYSRAKYYQQMFETRSRFDNRYVTKELRDLDLRRLRQGRETVLPLNTRERAKYVSVIALKVSLHITIVDFGSNSSGYL